MDYEQFAKLVGCSSRSIRRMVAAKTLSPPPFSIDSIGAAKALLQASKKGRANNLVKHTATDLQEPGTVPVTAKLAPEDVLWLRSLPEGASFHIRQAVKMYRCFA